MIQVTTGRVPVSVTLQQACGLPLVCICQPFAPADGAERVTLAASEVARCQECLAYINHLCPFNASGWMCALCGTQNDFASAANRRYLGVQARAALPELQGAAVEAAGALHSGDAEEGIDGVYEVDAQPIVLAVVDTVCRPEFLELVRSALLAALEALPPSALFGLVAFGGADLSLFEPCPGAPSVRHVRVTPTAAAPTAVDLDDALPLRNLLAPVGPSKAAIAAAIEALAPAEGGARERPFGEALQAVLRYLGSSMSGPSGPHGGGGGGDDSPPLPASGSLGTRLFVFLSGPPNDGRGSVVRPAAQLSSSSPAGVQDHPAPYLMDPYFPELTSWGAAQAAAAEESSVDDGSSDTPGAAWRRRQFARGGNKEGKGAGGWRAAADAAAALGPAAEELQLEPDSLEINWHAELFYEEAGAAAAALGVCVDLYAASPHFVGLEVLRPLPSFSGGAAVLYSSLAEGECALPQDVYKRVSDPAAFQCLLRVRTSPEMRVRRPLSSRLEKDTRFEDLFRLPCCHPHDAFGLELEHCAPCGFASGSTPVVQLVLQYLHLAPASTASDGETQSQVSLPSTPATSAAPAAANGHSSAPRRQRYALQRRVRIVTASFPLARSAAEVYAGANAAALSFALMQQLAAVADVDGLAAARESLVDWQVSLTAAYHEWVTVGEYHPAPDTAAPDGAHSGRVDPSFAAVEAMQQLPRLAYALLHGPLLGAGRQAHPDATCAVRMLWETLPPDELATAIYPRLSSWATPDQLSFPRHSLSHAALLLSNQPIYLLDTWTTLVVLYTAAAAAAGLRFPPAHGTALRAHLAAVRQARRLTPRLVTVREGAEGDDLPFTRWLVEDAPSQAEEEGAAAAGAGAPPSLLQFLKEVAAAAAAELAEG